jgi:methylated-DNA-[protein]-cysteine S-methyltransferase
VTITKATAHTVLPTRLGDLTVVRDGPVLIGLYFPGHWSHPDPSTFGPRSEAGFAAVAEQLEEYLDGQRQCFELRLGPPGNFAQRQVWDVVASLPYGQTTTYGDIARQLGPHITAREVGAIVGRNPLSIVIPCHRVVGHSGKLTGYAGGLARKRALLELEQPGLFTPLYAAIAAGGGDDDNRPPY